MIKTHNKTNLKYLCITKKENWKEYLGSGIRWRKHLNKHGNDISTELLYESDNYDDFLEKCLFVSTDLNVALGDEFANLVPETGYNNSDGYPNVVLWWRYASEELKQDIFRKRAAGLQEWWKNIPIEKRNEISKKISLKSKKYWENFTLEERRNLTRFFREGAIKFFENKDSEKYLLWKKRISETTRIRLANTDKKILSERNRKARLNISKESAEHRKKKIQEVYKTGKHNKLFEQYSTQRKGYNNPAAKKILWFGKIFPKLEFEKTIGKINSNKVSEEIRAGNCKLLFSNIKKNYQNIVCPYCKKQSNNKKPSTFKKYHLENCKEKK